MNEEKNRWDKIVSLPDEYQTNPELAENAIKEIKAREQSKAKNKRKPLWLSLAASFAACLVGLSVFLPIYLSPDGGQERLYYSSESITFTPIDSISDFVAQNNLDIFYFDNPMSTDHCAYTIEDNKIAFINQSTVFVDDDNVEFVTTKIVVLVDAVFYFSEDYNELTESIKINDILVYYVIPDNNEQMCRIRFNLNKAIYYIDIDSNYYSIETVEKYVTLLIN